MKKLILFLIIVLTLTSYAIADVYLYSGGDIVTHGTNITIDSATATTNFNGNTTGIGAGISGWGTVKISTTSIITATNNNYGIYINKNNETLTIYGEEKEDEEEYIPLPVIEINNNTTGIKIENGKIEFNKINKLSLTGNTTAIELTNSNSSLTITDVGQFEISNNTNGIIGKDENRITITGSTINLKDNVLALKNVNLTNSNIIITESNRTRNFDNVINNLSGSGNILTISGFKDGINLSSGVFKTVFTGLNSNSNNLGFFIKEETNIISNKDLYANSNNVGLKITTSDVTSTSLYVEVSNSTDAVQIINSKYKDNESTIDIIKSVNNGFSVDISTVNFYKTDLYIKNSGNNGLQLKKSSMTADGGLLTIENSKNYGIYADNNSYLKIQNIRYNGNEILMNINNNKYGIYGQTGAKIDLINNVINLKDNTEKALVNVNLISNTITIVQTDTNKNYRKNNLSDQLKNITGSGNNLTISGFNEGINLSSSNTTLQNILKIFNGNLTSNDNGYGFMLVSTNTQVKDIQLKMSSNTVGFIVKNSTATISLSKDFEISYSGHSSTDSKKTDVGGMNITKSSVTVNNNLILTKNKGYGLNVSGSQINLLKGITLNGADGSKGIKIANSKFDMAVNTKIDIKEVTGAGLEISASTYNATASAITISSASAGILITEKSNVIFSTGIVTGSEGPEEQGCEIKIISVAGTAINVIAGSTLTIINAENIIISSANKGIIGETGSKIEIIGSKLTFDNVTGMLLDKVNLTKSSLTVSGAGKETETENNFIDKVNITGGYGNMLIISDFYEGFKLTEKTKKLLKNGTTELINNNIGLVIENLSNVEIQEAVVKAISNETGLNIINSSVTVSASSFTIANNTVGLKIANSTLTGGSISITGNTVGVEITGSGTNFAVNSLNASNNDIGIKINSGATFKIKETPVILENNSLAAIEVADTGSSLEIIDNLQINKNGGTSEVILKAVNGGSIKVSSQTYQLINGEAADTTVYASGSNSIIKFNSFEQDGIGNTKTGILAENGGVITANNNITVRNNKESGVEIKGAGSNITFNSLTSTGNGYGIKVSSNANYTLNAQNILLSNNSIAAIALEDANLNVKSKFNFNHTGEQTAVLIKGESALNFEDEVKLDGYNDEGGNLANAILIEDSVNSSIGFKNLTITNSENAFGIIKSTYSLSGSLINFSSNTVALNVAGSSVSITKLENIINYNNDIFLNVESYDDGENIYASSLKSSIAELNIGNNNETGLKISGVEGYKSEVNFEDTNLISNNNLQDGIVVDNYSILTANKIEVSSNTNAGLKITGTDSEIKISTLVAKYNNYGVEISSVTGSINLQVDNMEVEENTGAGIHIMSSSITVKKDMTVSGNNIGFLIENSTVTVNAMVTATNNILGLNIENSNFSTKGLTLSGSTYGIMVEQGKTTEINFIGNSTEFNLLNNTEGICLQGGTLILNGDIDKMVTEGADVVSIMAGGLLKINGEGFRITNSNNGIVVTDTDSKLEVTKEIEVSNNNYNGIYATSSGTIKAGTIIAKNNKLAGININSESKVEVKGIDIEGGIYGIYADNGILTISGGGNITGSRTGFYVTKDGIVDLGQSTMTICQSTVAIDVTGNKNIKAEKATLNLSSNTTALQIAGGIINIGSATIAGNTVGIEVSENGNIEGKIINLSSNTVSIKVSTDSNFTISNNIENLSLTGNSIGFLASGANSKITIDNTSAITTKDNDTLIKAEDNGMIAIVAGTISGNKTAISAINGGSIIGTSLTLKENETAIKAEENGNIIFTEALNITNNEIGLNLAGGAISADSISITGNTVGVAITSSTNNLKNATITNNETGIELTDGNLTLTNGTISGNTIGIDFKNNTTLTATALNLTGNETAGINIEEGTNATIAVTNLTLGIKDVIAITGGTLNLNNTNIRKDKDALFNSNAGVINLTDGTIEAESLTAAGNTTTLTANNSRITSKIENDDLILNLTKDSNWQLKQKSNLKELSLNNSTVTIGANSLTVNKLAGSGETNVINIAVDVSKENGDYLIITEDGQISGNFKLALTNAKEVAKNTVKDTIRIIDTKVENNPNTFALNNDNVNIQGYIYKLYQGSQLNVVNSSSVEKYSWYLVNSKEISEYINAMVKTGDFLTLTAKNAMNTINKRVGDLRRTSEDRYSAVWVRGFGKSYDISDTPKSNMSVFGAEGGYDMRILKSKQDRYYLGLMVGYQQINSISIEEKQEGKDTTGNGSAPSFGIYASWLAQNGWYADVVARYIMVETKMTGYNDGTAIEYKPKMNYLGLSAEVGKEFEMDIKTESKLKIEPKAEISLATGQGNTIEVSDGSEIEYAGVSSINAKLAVSVGYEIEIEEDKKIIPFIQLGYNNEFGGKMDINYMDNKYTSDISGSGFEISGGANAQLWEGITAYGLISFESADKQSNLGFNLGVRYGFGGEKLPEQKTNKNKQSKKNTKKTNSVKEKIKQNQAVQKVKKIEETMEEEEEEINTSEIEKVIVRKDSVREVTVDGRIEEKEIENNNKVEANELTQEQKKYIIHLAKGLAEEEIEAIGVAGYVVDISGDEAENKKNSVIKAKRVKQILMKLGIDGDKIKVRGYGSKKPVASNKTKEGRAKNDRIEIFIKR